MTQNKTLIYLKMETNIYTYIGKYMWIHAYISLYIYTYICIHIHTSVYVCVACLIPKMFIYMLYNTDAYDWFILNL